MKSFKTHQNTDHNKHIAHIEEYLYEHGAAGYRHTLNILEATVNHLLNPNNNYFPSRYNLTVKYDGSPSIVCGNNPENNQFFVATKSAFAKNPKLIYHHNDIDHYYPMVVGTNLSLKEVMEKCLYNLGYCFEKYKNIMQGDLMYYRKNNGVLKQNVLSYVVNENAPYELYEKIRKTDVGIIFHTEYWGKQLQELKNFYQSPNVHKLRQHDHIWFSNADIYVIGSDEPEITRIQERELSESTERLIGMSAYLNVIETISKNNVLREYFKQFENHLIREDVTPSDSSAKFYLLHAFADTKLTEAINDVKMDVTKANKRHQKDMIMRFLENYEHEIRYIFDLTECINSVKIGIINAYDSLDYCLLPFVEDENGDLQKTGHEGYVITDKNNGITVKLVNRQEFSRINFLQNDL